MTLQRWKLQSFVAFLFIFILDTGTKLWALAALKSQSIFVGSFLGIDLFFTLATNEGAAWSVGSDFPKLLLALRFIIIIGMSLYLFSRSCPTGWRIPLACALSGAICNVRDSCIWGHVIDMIDVILWGYSFPIFNVADCCICIAVVVLFFRINSIAESTS